MEQELYKLPEKWEWESLGSIIDFKNGYAFKSKDFRPSGIPVLRISNIQSGRISFERMAYVPENLLHDRITNFFVEKNDIVIAMSGATTGKVAINESGQRLLQNQRVGRFVIVDPVLRSYVYYYLNAKVTENLQKSLGAAQPNLSTAQINEIKIPIPTLDEQKRIVTKLDALFTRIDAAIAHLQETLELSKALFASALAQAVSSEGRGWPLIPLNEIGQFTGGGTPSKGKSEYWKGEIPWITPKDMKAWEIADSELKITPLGVSNSSAKMIPRNSVLIVARSGILRHTLPVCINRVEATVNQDIKVFIPTMALTPEYFQYMLKGNESFILSQLVKGGVTVESLKYKEFQSHKFPVPPIEEQGQIVTQLDALSERTSALETATEEKLSDLNDLKASLLDAAFRGQL
ncbi:MAG: restriction endonuclease subunit S [Proteobacteria bacterium]|nr:restriction endonuclease subunit S [Pseudomonadota bacterium]MBU1685870.1 restriction endonuclease subunit S [Pseudomonadota bacterium]